MRTTPSSPPMGSLTITLPGESLGRLRQMAEARGLSPEECASLCVVAGLSAGSGEDDASFERDLDYLLEKNAELYRRHAGGIGAPDR